MVLWVRRRGAPVTHDLEVAPVPEQPDDGAGQRRRGRRSERDGEHDVDRRGAGPSGGAAGAPTGPVPRAGEDPRATTETGSMRFVPYSAQLPLVGDAAPEDDPFPTGAPHARPVRRGGATARGRRGGRRTVVPGRPAVVVVGLLMVAGLGAAVLWVAPWSSPDDLTVTPAPGSAAATSAAPGVSSTVQVVPSGTAVDATEFSDQLLAGVLAAGSAGIAVESETLSGTGAVRYTAHGVDEQLDVTVGGTRLGLVFVDGTLHLRSGDGDYTAVPTTGTGAKGKALAAALKRLVAAADVTATAQQMRQASVTSMGATEDDGEVLRRYEVVLTGQDLATQLSTAERKALGSDLTAVRSRALVTVDEQFRPVRTEVTSTVDGTSSTVVLRYTDWGGEVDITAP